ncbi:glycosyltransferase [Nodosilinea sp. LEGE 07088]|uniref:glycosyltransferase family 2 protein n=1 Tax=Nodosilinea sp. LEGE 07088 TaxID=2777968 RepID=UPI00187E6F0E|nr:glycosyltransferase [Nodosilinea sp. LEGE 07088]MBE9139438.1 glycosyltransferase [Nodosilinea sp. LEGE 07088]
MSKPSFTFCIPNLNKIDFLPACIDSMLAQDSDTWRCVFVDGYSTDGSWDYMQQFANDPRFTLLRGKRQGMYADWNYCLEQVTTEYFYMLTSDDLCYPRLVSQTTQALDQYRDIDACHFKFEYINEHNQITRTYDDIVAAEMPIYLSASSYAHRRMAMFEFLMHFVYRTIYRTMTSLVLRRSVIDTVGFFSRQYGPAGDYDWTLRLAMHTDVLFLPETLTAWRKYEGQATQSPYAVDSCRRMLAIATANLKAYQTLKVTPELPEQLLLSFLSNTYETALYRHAHNPQHGIANIRQLGLAVYSYPLHYLNALAKRLRFPLLQPTVTKSGLATTLMQRYHLRWPPEAIDLPQSQAQSSLSR